MGAILVLGPAFNSSLMIRYANTAYFGAICISFNRAELVDSRDRLLFTRVQAHSYHGISNLSDPNESK